MEVLAEPVHKETMDPLDQWDQLVHKAQPDPMGTLDLKACMVITHIMVVPVLPVLLGPLAHFVQALQDLLALKALTTQEVTQGEVNDS